MEFNRFVNRVTLVLFILIGWAGWQIWSPRSLSQYEGHAAPAMQKEAADSYLKKVQSTLKNGETYSWTEPELNAFLKSVIHGEQSYAVKPWVDITGVFINLEPSQYSLCLAREVYGRANHIEISHALTSTQTSAHRIKTSVEANSGMLGKLKLPVRMVYHISPWFPRFMESLQPVFSELKPLVGAVEIKDGVLLLHPYKKL